MRSTVFVSYSHRDSRWLERLQVHLRPYDRRGDLVLWDDTRIDPGDKWRHAIATAIDEAQASILLISADFLASDFVTSHELPTLLHKAARSGMRIIPIVVQPCRLANHPDLASFHTLNPPNQPLSRLLDAEAEEWFVRAAEQLEKLVLGPRDRATSSNAASASDELFAELQVPAMSLGVLAALSASAGTAPEFTVTELRDVLQATSRKLVYVALDKLVTAGWLDKRRDVNRTLYRLSAEGHLQFARLVDSAGKPLRSIADGRTD